MLDHPALQRELSATGFTNEEELMAQIADRVELANHYYVLANSSTEAKGNIPPPRFVPRPKEVEAKPKMASHDEIMAFAKQSPKAQKVEEPKPKMADHSEIKAFGPVNPKKKAKV